jgi:hypothetical protein
MATDKDKKKAKNKKYYETNKGKNILQRRDEKAKKFAKKYDDIDGGEWEVYVVNEQRVVDTLNSRGAFFDDLEMLVDDEYKKNIFAFIPSTGAAQFYTTLRQLEYRVNTYISQQLNATKGGAKLTTKEKNAARYEFLINTSMVFSISTNSDTDERIFQVEFTDTEYI